MSGLPASSDYRDEIDATELVLLGDRLAAIPPAFRRESRKAIEHAGQDMLHEAMFRASWSRRIPSSLSLRVQLGARPRVSLRASLQIAPHARAFEGLYRRSWRHPVFGHTERWVSQDAKPYMWPAAALAGDRFREDLVGIVNDVHRAAGLL